MAAAAPRLSRRAFAIAAAVVALLFAVLLSLAVGARTIAPSAVLDALLHGGQSDAAEVVRQMRVPRTVIGLMVGAALALAGTVLQGITRNPIADPGILGVSAGAALGVVLGITAGFTTLSGYVWFAFLGAGLASVVVYAVASTGRVRDCCSSSASSGVGIRAVTRVVRRR